ncbi:MAG: sortase [Chloroflexota bacterium]|nr:MAG: sortase [Chloroflexota bacterium]TMD83336.1 MAG: sortase [Chloroflexota bacterium]
MMGAMRRNLIAGLLIAGGLALMATSVPALGLLRAGPQAVAIQPIPGLGDPLSPPHQHAKFLPGTGSTGAGPSQVVAYLSIPKLGIKNAQVFDRGVDGGGNMLIAKGYAITHYANSSPIGSGNAVLYGHDDIEGSIFARLQELAVGDELDVTTSGGEAVVYHVTTRTIVAPTAVEILRPTNDVRLTVFTCWPTWVDSKRVVVTAVPATA